MTSLDLVQRFFLQEAASKDSAPTNLLVIMSDMIEDSDRYDFDTLSLTSNRVAAIIRSERESGRLPDLTGVRVCVAGASGGSVRYHEVRQFWAAYLDSVGATLVDYGGPFVGCSS